MIQLPSKGGIFGVLLVCTYGAASAANTSSLTGRARANARSVIRGRKQAARPRASPTYLQPVKTLLHRRKRRKVCLFSVGTPLYGIT